MCVSGAFRAVVLLAASELLWWNPRVVVICARLHACYEYICKRALCFHKRALYFRRELMPELLRWSPGVVICVSRSICTCAMTYSYVCRVTFLFATWLIDMCDMTHWYVWHFSCICLKPELLWWNPRVAVMCVTCHTRMCDMTHSYVCRDPFMCVTWPIHMCDMTNSYVWHDSLICVKL